MWHGKQLRLQENDTGTQLVALAVAISVPLFGRRPPLGADTVLQVKPLYCPLGPSVAPEGLPAVDAGLQALQFLVFDWLVHPPEPICRPIHRPRPEDRPQRIGAVVPRPKTPPSPVLGTLDQSGGQCITLHVSTRVKKMPILLHRETLEAALVQVPVSHRTMRDPPAHGMGMGQPAEEGGQVAVPLGQGDGSEIKRTRFNLIDPRPLYFVPRAMGRSAAVNGSAEC